MRTPADPHRPVLVSAISWKNSSRLSERNARMKALLIAWILTILAIAANAQSPVSVSGHAMIPDASATQNTSIRFELTGCDKGQARVPGVAVFSDYKKDFLVNSTTGAFSGTLYANAVIDCNGTLGATKYNVTVLY